ncbi:hypothetical protein CRYUN_Cryun15aG0129600 [Craigia yunnanensis]
MAKPRELFSSCSLLMAVMFGFSLSAQLNDPDWYFWFPLYACAGVVNLLNWRISPKGASSILRKNDNLSGFQLRASLSSLWFRKENEILNNSYGMIRIPFPAWILPDTLPTHYS